MNALYDGIVDPNLSARNVRFGWRRFNCQPMTSGLA